MKRLLLAVAVAASLVRTPAHAQAVACQAVYTDRTITLQFARQSRTVAHALLARLDPAIVALEERIEQGVLAELEGGTAPARFGDALAGLSDVTAAADELDRALAALQAIHEQDHPLALFEDALAKILRERHVGARPPAVRYARAAGASHAPAEAPTSVGDILRLQRRELVAVRAAFDELADALRTALPLARDGKLAAASFGGRVPLPSALQEAIARWEDYRSLCLETCRATIAATEQGYPEGLRWLDDPDPPPGS